MNTKVKQPKPNKRLSKIINKQTANIRQIQRFLKCKLKQQFYTRYISKNNWNVLMSLNEEKKVYCLLKLQLKKYKELKTNIHLIDQQLGFLNKLQNVLLKGLETKYSEDLKTQEVRNYTIISSNLDDLKKMLFKEDFKLKRSKNQFPENEFNCSIINREQEQKVIRKKIYYCLIIIHLFINLKNNKVKKCLQKKEKLNLKARQSQDLQQRQVVEYQKLQSQLQQIENNNSVNCQKKQEIEQHLQKLKSYISLIQQYLQIEKQNSQYAVYQAQDKQQEQMMLGFLNELRSNIDETEQMIHNNVLDDLNSAVLLENNVQELKQVWIERKNLREQNKEVISLKQGQQLDQNQINEIKIILSKHNPQIDQLSQEQMQIGIDNFKARALNLEEQITKGQSLLTEGQAAVQDINRRIIESAQKGDELNKKVLDIQKQLELIQKSINTQSNQSKQIKSKFDQIKLKSIQSQESLLSDLKEVIQAIDGYNRRNDPNKIQKEFEEFISKLNKGGQNHINVSFEQNLSNLDEQLNQFDHKKRILIDKKTLIIEELKKYEKLRQEVKIGRQTIKKTIKKYKQQKERIKRRSQLFDLVVRK